MFHGSQHCFNFFQTFINFSSHFDIFNWDRLSAIKVNQVCVKNKFYEWPSHKVNCESNPSKPTFSRKISFLIDWRSLNWPVLWILIIEKSCLFAFRITNIAEKNSSASGRDWFLFVQRIDNNMKLWCILLISLYHINSEIIRNDIHWNLIWWDEQGRWNAA